MPPSPTAQTILAPARIVRMLAEKLLTDIEPAQFARKPSGVDMNHPAWVYGHIIFPIDESAKLAGLITGPDLPSDWAELFSRESPARDVPDGTIYPPMRTITDACLQRLDAVMAALESCQDDAVFTQPNTTLIPHVFPTVGGVLNGSLNTHSVMHLGQVSAWRRVMGLGPCL